MMKMQDLGLFYGEDHPFEKETPADGSAGGDLLDMLVVIDMFDAVAIVTFATRAVAEFQVRAVHIGASADGTFVGVGCFGLDGTCLIGTGIGKRNDFGTGFLAGLSLEQPPGIDPPRHGDDIQHVLAEEEKIVGKGDDREPVQWERIEKKGVQHQYEINQGEDPCFYRNDKEQQELRIGEQCGIAEEQTQIQIRNVCLPTEDHAVNIHHHNTGEIEKIEFQCTPDILHGTPERIVAKQGNGDKEKIVIAATVGQRISEQAPDLPLQDLLLTEAKQVIQLIIACKLTHQINQRTAETEIQHQVGDTLISVFIAQPIEPGS